LRGQGPLATRKDAAATHVGQTLLLTPLMSDSVRI
jgi:hypothetical protein